MFNNQKIKIVLLLSGLVYILGCGSVRGSHPAYHLDETYRQARAYYEAGQYAQAKEYYKKFIETHPDDPLYEIALYYLGSCFQKTADYSAALSIYQRLIDLYKKGFWVELARQEIRSILRLGGEVHDSQ